jgi:hypothetical protein
MLARLEKSNRPAQSVARAIASNHPRRVRLGAVARGISDKAITVSKQASPLISLIPNKGDISAHLYALFNPVFVQPHPDAWIEIAYGRPDGPLNAAANFSAFKLEKAVEFAEAKNKAGYNVYVGVALRQGEKPASGRANGDHVLDASHLWAEFDGAGDAEHIDEILKGHKLTPAMVVTTGTVPHLREHLYFKLDGTVTPERLEAANTALCKLLGSDAVQNPDRVMRLAGTVSYPSPKKKERGYVEELTALRVNKNARAYKADDLIGVVPAKDGFDIYAEGRGPGQGRSDAELMALLKSVNGKDGGKEKWHTPMCKAVATMIGRGMTDSAIKFACAAYCDGGLEDPELKELIDTGRKTFNKPSVEIPVEGSPAKESDVVRLNKLHAILPIGGKTRVVTFGELEDFPDRETIVMTQTIGDFKLLQNKYRHKWIDKDGGLKSSPLGTHWIGSSSRRQYDGGMAFMPKHDGDVGNRLNLWNGFGFKPIKPAPGSRGEAGCQKFLDFMRDIICSGNKENFDYLIKREATILQKRIRSEIALGLRTKEEGCGKGFYEKVMGLLLGNHSMQVTNPKHIIGNFNPHLETLLRLTADEALFVGNHEHRNSLFGLITEGKLTIEPKGCGVYQADSFLNISVLSNADHFVPVSGTARRFFIPTVSIARMQDVAYFGDLEADLESGGYEALLYYFLHEVDLTGFNVRLVPQTAGLREQRDQSLEALDAWWVELLETGTLTGSDPLHPHKAVSNSYTREIKIEMKSAYGDSSTQVRHVTQRGLYDQARLGEPKLRNISDHKLGAFLREMGCDNSKKVLRKQGWSFPPLADCRAAWEKRYPNWKWRNTEITKWQTEEADDVAEAIQDGPRIVVDNEIAALIRQMDTQLTAMEKPLDPAEMAALIKSTPEAIAESIASGRTKF